MYVRLTAATNHSSISISPSANCIVISSYTRSQVTQKISILIPLRIYGFQRTAWVYYTSYEYILTNHKKAGGMNLIPHPVVFSKMNFLERGGSPGFLWLLVLSYVTSFLKILLKFFKSFRRYQDFLLRCFSSFVSFTNISTFPCYKETDEASIQQIASAFFYIQPILRKLFNNYIELY